MLKHPSAHPPFPDPSPPSSPHRAPPRPPHRHICNEQLNVQALPPPTTSRSQKLTSHSIFHRRHDVHSLRLATRWPHTHPPPTPTPRIEFRCQTCPTKTSVSASVNLFLSHSPSLRSPSALAPPNRCRITCLTILPLRHPLSAPNLRPRPPACLPPSRLCDKGRCYGTRIPPRHQQPRTHSAAATILRPPLQPAYAPHTNGRPTTPSSLSPGAPPTPTTMHRQRNTHPFRPINRLHAVRPRRSSTSADPIRAEPNRNSRGGDPELPRSCAERRRPRAPLPPTARPHSTHRVAVGAHCLPPATPEPEQRGRAPPERNVNSRHCPV